MDLNIFNEPELDNPEMIAAWPGIGNIGLVAVDTLRESVEAELFAEIIPWDYFYPRGLTIQNGVLTELHFPSCKFYYKRFGHRDVIFFTGEEQPNGSKRAYKMTNLVLDIAQRYGCTRIYTTAAAVAPVHHSMTPRIWGVPNTDELIEEVKQYPNTILMSDIESRGGEGNITGLNGLLLGMARERGLKGTCLLGEVPVYISQFPTIYPKASKVIAELLVHNLQINPDLSKLDSMIKDVEEHIGRLYDMIPSEMRDHLEGMKDSNLVQKDDTGTITEEDKRKIMQDIEQFFDKGNKED